MSIRLRRLVAILALVGHGCASDQMRYTANRVAARVPDVYQTQIMENLARTAANPGSMPYLSRLFNGTASATDTATGVVSLTGKSHSFTSVNYGLSSISRGVQANIGLDPIDNPDKLAAMHVAYRMIVAPQTVDPVTHTTCLGPFLVNTNHCVASLPPPGWLHRGDKHHGLVPRRRMPMRAHLRLGHARRSRLVDPIHVFHPEYRDGVARRAFRRDRRIAGPLLRPSGHSRARTDSSTEFQPDACATAVNGPRRTDAERGVAGAPRQIFGGPAARSWFAASPVRSRRIHAGLRGCGGSLAISLSQTLTTTAWQDRGTEDADDRDDQEDDSVSGVVRRTGDSLRRGP